MVKENIDCLRVRYGEFKNMLRQTWFKWDSKTNKMTVKATKDVWEDFTEIVHNMFALLDILLECFSLTISCVSIAKIQVC